MTLLWLIDPRGNGWIIYVRVLEVKEGLWDDSLGRMQTAIRLNKRIRLSITGGAEEGAA